jgi:hypothetical protein
VEYRLRRRAQPRDVAGVWGNLRLDENNVHNQTAETRRREAELAIRFFAAFRFPNAE